MLSRRRNLHIALCTAWTLALALFLTSLAHAQERPVLVPQMGHSSAVYGVAFSPDGRTLVSAGGDNVVILWDVVTGEARYTLQAHTSPVLSVAFNPDGRTLASASGDGIVILWDATSGEVRRTLKGHTASVSSVAFSPDGRTLASGSEDNTVRLWDAASGEIRRTLRGHTNSVSTVAFSADGRTLVSGGRDNTVILWDPTTGEVRRTLRGHTRYVNGVAFSPDGRTLASASADRSIRLWDITTGETQRVLRGLNAAVLGVAFSPDGRTLVTGSADGSVMVWDTVTGTTRHTLRKHQSSVLCVAFNAQGQSFASGSGDNTVILWDAATGAAQRTLTGHAHFVAGVAFSPDGRTLASSGGDNSVTLWDMVSGEARRALKGHKHFVTSLAFSPDGQTLASASWDMTVILWDVVGNGLRAVPPRTLEGHKSQVSSVAFSPDGRTLASGDGDGVVMLWDVATGKTRRTFRGHTALVTSVAFSPDGSTLASSSFDKTVILWDAEIGKVIRTLRGHTDNVRDVAFSPDGRTLASAGFDKTVMLWDVVGNGLRAVPQRTLRGHTEWVTSVAFSPDGRTLASGSFDKTIVLWDVGNGEAKRTLKGHTHWVMNVAFSPDGRRLASGGWDGTARVWDTARGVELVTAFSLDGGLDYLVTTSDGYYNGSLNGGQMIRWRVGDRLFPVEQYEARFKRPDVVARALQGDPTPPELPKISAHRTPPVVTLEPVGGATDVEGDSADVRVVVAPGAPDAAIKKVELRVNGRPVDLERAHNVRARGFVVAATNVEVAGQDVPVQREDNIGAVPKHAPLIVTATVTLLPGETEARLVASAYDEQDLRGDSVIVVLTRRTGPRALASDLYVLAVGISQYAQRDYNLRFADADARELSATLKEQEGKAFRRVEVKTLTNEEATNEGLRAGLKWLQDAPQGNDVAVVLFSGHGVRGESGKLYFFTHNGNRSALRDTCVGWDEVDESLRRCRARQVVMFMDCCHAGAFGEQVARADELVAGLVKKTGVAVFASSRGNEQSFERAEWGHGAFTQAVLDGLRGKADPYNRGIVTVTALLDYVAHTVSSMTNGRQTPWLPRAEQFDLQLKLAKVR